MRLNSTESCTRLDDATHTQSFDSGSGAHGSVPVWGKRQAYLQGALYTDEIDRMRTNGGHFSSHFVPL